MSKKLQFPEDFLWGSATSAHQVEGGTKNNWTVWENENAQRLASEAKAKWQTWQQEKFPEMFQEENYISGKACDHYNLFEKDFDIAKELGHNVHRFSIEWSRIEPEEGKFDENEIEHYRKVITALRERGIEPFVTLWHWTNPLWLEKEGGIASELFVPYFSRYVDKVSQALGNEAKFWVTLNEPTSLLAAGYVKGNWPPQKRNPFAALSIYKILSDAHKEAYGILHKNCQNIQVGFADMLWYFEPANKNSILDKLVVKIADYFTNGKFLKMTEGYNDFLTAQYYFYRKFAFPGITKNSFENVTDMGWDIHAEGMYHVIMHLKKYNLPIYITENGLADADDEIRTKFINDHLSWTHKAIADGADVRGYFYWSLLDNFEWDKGFWPRFGLVEVDFKSQERKIRPSALEYAKICKSNVLEIEK